MKKKHGIIKSKAEILDSKVIHYDHVRFIGLTDEIHQCNVIYHIYDI